MIGNDIDKLEAVELGDPDDDVMSQDDSQVTDDPALKDSNSGSGRSTAGTSATGDGDDEASKFVKRESRHVLYLRLIVVLLLVCASLAISLVVWFVTTSGQDENFEGQYYAAADKVLDAFLDIATVKLTASSSLIVAMVAHGVDHHRDWPFVTLSSFQKRASTLMESAGALYVGFSPIVTHDQKFEWENYTNNDADAMHWYPAGRKFQQLIGIDDLDNRPQIKTDDPNLNLNTGVANHIYDFERNMDEKAVISRKDDWYLPIWQTSPVTQRTMVNQNRKSNSQAAIDAIKYDEIVFEGLSYSTPGYGSDDNPVTAEIAWLLRMANKERTKYEGDIFSAVYFPVRSSFEDDHRTVAVMRVIIHWAGYFRQLLPESVQGMIFVLDNGCDEPYTYEIKGAKVAPLGHGDLHDSKYDQFMKTTSFAKVDSVFDGTGQGMKLRFDECQYTIRTYPSALMEDTYKENTPVVVTVSVAIVFFFAILMFFAYDRLVERRQRILMQKARRTHQIVASLFPKNIRDQILNDEGELRNGGLLGAKNNIRSFVKGGMDENNLFGQMPIADLYPESTVMFADISGFTSWASSREPAQVFILLQNVYGAFDAIAKKRKVFKVETIGDSYVACAGVPEADPAHAVKMARFAWDCLAKMREVTRDLETQLGPGTGELTMRFGLHSGPVTAGLLRGDRARFQLFGDTVNTAARMESTGMKGRIQCSQSCADQLTRSGSGKEHWVEAREDQVMAKGKGILQTYWLTPYVDRAFSARSGRAEDEESNALSMDCAGQLATDLLKREREVEWVAELFRDSIRDIVAQRATRKGKIVRYEGQSPRSNHRNCVPIDEVVNAIKMPEFDPKSADAKGFMVKIPDKVSALIREYVSIIAAAYPKNPFHCFEHATHVVLCVSKFVKRISSPELRAANLSKLKDNKKMASHLHSYTHGINSDPITLFAILFSALIHDTDHPGVSNSQLEKEKPALAQRYHKKCIAEQNSVDVAWDVLMDSHFREMRSYIFETEEELSRFRQVVVNIVLATDIFDPDLNKLRKDRWVNAFSEQKASASTSMNVNDARATVVLEHIMQASDVCHTMQHWHIYLRFNRLLFEEIALAHRNGRCGADPTTFWYEGELKFFDNYVIPLAQKLKDCNVFGASSDECLNFALRNRAEWEDRGKGVVAVYVEAFAEKYKNSSTPNAPVTTTVTKPAPVQEN